MKAKASIYISDNDTLIESLNISIKRIQSMIDKVWIIVKKYFKIL